MTKYIITILLTNFFCLILEAQFSLRNTWKDDSNDSIENDKRYESDKEMLDEIGGTWEKGLNGYLFDKLPAFEDYKWEHENLKDFANNVVECFFILKNRFPNKTISMAVQGIADNRSIKEYKYWDIIDKSCNPQGKTGRITNLDLAKLRAYYAKKAVEDIVSENVKILEAVDYTGEYGKGGNEYKAVIFYMIIQ